MARPESAVLDNLCAQAESAPVELRLEADDRGVGIGLPEPRLHYYHSFVTGPLARRAKQTGQALIRACNNKQRSISRVLDLTAGWGADSLTLACQGQQILLLEQSTLLCAVLEYSLECLRSADTAVAARMEIECANSVEYLRALDSADEFDCIYLDPMFPPHKSNAKPAKDMQLLQALTGNSDIAMCFELALEKARNRVVVKRPARAPGLHESRPDLVYREKSVRFDVYLTA